MRWFGSMGGLSVWGGSQPCEGHGRSGADAAVGVTSEAFQQRALTGRGQTGSSGGSGPQPGLLVSIGRTAGPAAIPQRVRARRRGRRWCRIVLW